MQEPDRYTNSATQHGTRAEPPRKRDRSTDQPRLSVSLPPKVMKSLQARARTLGLSPQEMIQLALKGIHPVAPATFCFPVLLTVRHRLEDIQRQLDPVVEQALASIGTHRDSAAILTALGEIHLALTRISKQVDQGL